MPLDEVPGGGEILGDGLLGEDVLARREGALDDLRLDEDREADDDGGDVVAGEEVGQGLALGRGRVVVQSDR